MQRKEPCEMCQEARKSRTPHTCKICGNVVCNFCSDQDPESDNEMHRVLSEPGQYSVTSTTSQQLACPHCEKMVEITSKLNEHTNSDHPEGFESLDQITLDSRIDCSSAKSVIRYSTLNLM